MKTSTTQSQTENTTLWTPDAVKAALINAFEVDEATGGRWKPKSDGNAVPVFLTPETSEAEASDDDAEPFQMKRVYSAAKITQMEIVLLGHERGGRRFPMWLGGFMHGQDGPRNCLEAYAMQTAYWGRRGKKFNEKKFCRRIGWNYQTYVSRRDRGAEILAYKLNAAGIECWFNSGPPLPKGVGSRKAGKVPVDVVVLDLIKQKPRTRGQCISHMSTQGIPGGTAHAVKVAITKLERSAAIRKLGDGRYQVA